MKGRAEYEDIVGKELFEGVSATSLYPWMTTAFDINDYKGLVIAERGTGKTFFGRMLAQEIPTKFYILDKGKLNYIMFMESDSKPKLYILDDMHFLLPAMRLGILKDSPVREEGEVLRMLKNIANEAKESKAKCVFMSNEGPAGLSANFLNENNRREFLELMYDCYVTSDDDLYFNRYLKKYSSLKGSNVYKFREDINNELSVKIRKELGMNDTPLVIPEIARRTSITSSINYYKTKFRKEEEVHFIVSPDENEKIIFSSPSKKVISRGSDVKMMEKGDKVELWTPSEPEQGNVKVYNPKTKVEHVISIEGKKLIAPIRMIKVLYDEIGGVNRKNLGIWFGSRWTPNTSYRLDQVEDISEIMYELYSKIYKQYPDKMNYLLAKSLLSAKDENEIRAVLIEHELSKE